MKIIILCLLSLNSFAQWQAKWKHLGLIDTLENSIDNKNWSIISIIQNAGDTNLVTIPGPTYYYKARSGKLSTNVALVNAILPISITNTSLLSSKTSVIVNWTSQNENNLQAWEVDRSFDNITFSLVSKFSPNGVGPYSVTILRPTSTSTNCIKKFLGMCFKKQTITTIDSRKEYFEIISIDFDGNFVIQKTLSE